MSSPEMSPPAENYSEREELSETPNFINIYAPAIYGQDNVMEDLKEVLKDEGFASISLEDDEDEANMIKAYYYGDEDEIDEKEVLKVVKRFDGSARIIQI